MTLSPPQPNTSINAITAWNAIAALGLTIDDATSTRSYELSGATSFVRKTTEIILSGNGFTGTGENVAYQTDVHAAVVELAPTIDLRGSWTFGELCAHLDTINLVPEGEWIDYPSFHRWAFESAALDLALLQAGKNLSQVIGSSFEPLRFCVSMGLGEPPDISKVTRWLDVDSQIQFKIDSSNKWTADLIRDLAATNAVCVIDIKGHYKGDWIDNEPIPELYANIAEIMPNDTLIEDAMLNDETKPALANAHHRLTWDAPTHSLADLEALEFAPGAINIKPSRINSLQELLAIIHWCNENNVPNYAGGQFELARGRTQAQQLASIFYPHAANDIAPVAWHTAQPGDVVPMSPLTIPTTSGFGFDA